jgi:hypothetical protein
MADVTGATKPTNATSVDVAGDIADVYDHFGDQNKYSRANAAALPASGNWLGRQLMAEDTKWRYQCTVLPGTWAVISTPATTASLSMGSGYSLTSGNVYLNGLFVTVSLTVTKSSTIAHDDTVLTIPSGHRPAALSVSTGRMHGVANYNTAHVEVSTAGVMKVYFNGANTEDKLSVNMTFLRA